MVSRPPEFRRKPKASMKAPTFKKSSWFPGLEYRIEYSGAITKVLVILLNEEAEVDIAGVGVVQ